MTWVMDDVPDAPASDGPATEAGRRFLVDLPGRYGQAAVDPISHELTIEAVLAIEAEAAAEPRVVKFDQNTTPEEAERIYRWMNPATEPHTEAGRELLTGLPWMGREHRLILAIEAEAAAGARVVVGEVKRRPGLDLTGYGEAAAGPRSEGLDVQRLTKALAQVGWHHADARQQAQVIAAEYDRLSAASSSESEP